MAVPTQDEYVEVDGLPLDTPAWHHVNPEMLYGSGDVAGGGGLRVAYDEGERPSPGWPGPLTLAAVIEVRGSVDPDGNPHPNVRAGLRRNVDTVKRALRPRSSGDGTVLLVHRLADDVDRDARCQVTGPLQEALRGGTNVRLTIPLWLPDGVLRDVTPTTVSGSSSAGAAFDLAVPNPGSADQLDAQITLTGTATSVQITSPVFGGVSLTFDGALGSGVTIDTGEFTAVRDGVDVHGLVSASGHPRWLPVPAGGATWTVTPSGGNVTVDVSHRAAWS